MEENDDSGFTIPPPDFTQGDYSTPYDQRAAMTLKLIKNKLDSTLLPLNIKTTIYTDMGELVNNSSMTNISIGQIKEFLGDFDLIWMNYETFVNRSYRKELNYIKSIIRTIFKQNLNKSKDSMLLRLVFEDHHRYEVRQKHEKVDEKVSRWKDRFKKKSKEIE